VEGHIVRTFDGDILNLRMQALSMGGLAIDQVQRAVLALTRGDDEAAREVVARADQVAGYARAIDDEIVGLIARRQPVASDLRAILTVGRVTADIERVGNAARKIARLAIQLHEAADGAPLHSFYNDVRKMARIAVSMLRDALDCFDRVDIDGAAAVAKRDQELDGEFHLALRELVTYVMEDQRHLRSTIQTVFLLKALERVGDHARSIAGAVPRMARPDGPTPTGVAAPAAVPTQPAAPAPASPGDPGSTAEARSGPRAIGQG
jgi:phosphate transport system protein